MSTPGTQRAARVRDPYAVHQVRSQLDQLLPGWSKTLHCNPADLPPYSVIMRLARAHTPSHATMEKVALLYRTACPDMDLDFAIARREVRQLPTPVSSPAIRQSEYPRLLVAEDELQMTDAASFLKVMRQAQERSGRNPGQIAAITGIPRASAYALVDPKRTHLPTKKEQIVAFFRGCRLPEHQINLLLQIWQNLRQAPPKPIDAISDTSVERLTKPEDDVRLASDLEDRVVTAVQTAMGASRPSAAAPTSSARPIIAAFVAMAAVVVVVVLLVVAGVFSPKDVASVSPAETVIFASTAAFMVTSKVITSGAGRHVIICAARYRSRKRNQHQDPDRGARRMIDATV